MQSDANIVLEQISQLGLIPNMLKLNNFNLKWEILRWQEFEVSQECFWSAKDYFKRPFPKIWISRFLIKICRIVHHRDDDIVKNPKRNCKDSGTVPTTESALCNVCSKMFSSKKAVRVHIKMHDESLHRPQAPAITRTLNSSMWALCQNPIYISRHGRKFYFVWSG